VPADRSPATSLPYPDIIRIDAACNRFEADLLAGKEPKREDYVADIPEPAGSALLSELQSIEAWYRKKQNEAVESHPIDARPAQVREEIVARQPAAAEQNTAEHPRQIGRYRIEGFLGRGGFGTVYRGYDDTLKRPVAIKVPHRHLVSSPEHIELYISEARVLASLDHPNIVPVYDAGPTEDGLCYVVSKFIEGTNLAVKNRLSHRESAENVAIVAEALHHAHLHRVVHRDIKPSNILLDPSGKPYVVDFGLALTDEKFGQGSGGGGTLAYMSPEQARGEGHLVDGRSDIFSLGLVFYELLTAFSGISRRETIERIRCLEVRPPRQLDDSIPKELERICLKALSKRARDRYTTALDMAEDLRHFLTHAAEARRQLDARKANKPSSALAASPPGSDSSKLVKIVPKGLRSFDAQDADFFLELLPGPRDREGLPESIRFWKYRIEETNSDKTFRVGLIYGPSGCGKTSLVKAGLLPRLAEHVISIYVEATADDTEARLLRGLRKQCPGLEVSLGVKDSIAALRRGQAIPPGKKVLIVLDHFEQWLHARPSFENVELVEAVRQCDGERVQCIVMVRDDFWLAVTRFMQELEIELLEGQNSALVDLFHIDHAKKVLAAFGRAFGKLPENRAEAGNEQMAFLEQATAGLAQEGKIICVRLALFAEMMKGKAWTPGSLKAVGGTKGVGVTFLEETFSATTAPPELRLHQQAARSLLKALLPESSMEIRGHMRSYRELLDSSGYAGRPKDFMDVLRILDTELRLVTLTDPQGLDFVDRRPDVVEGKYYQLTHEYLVHALRDWLARKQKETRRGRAELRLAERSELWNSKRENRYLPTWWEYLVVRLLVKKKNWTEPQRKMMRKAGRYNAVGGLLLLVVLGLVGWGSYEGFGRFRAKASVDTLMAADTADTTKVREYIEEVSKYGRWAAPMLREIVDRFPDDSKEKLHASLALLQSDPSQVDFLSTRLLEATPSQVPIIVAGLAPDKDQLLEKLWAVVETPAKGRESQRLRAASALANNDPENQRWAKVQEAVGDDLVNEPAVDLAAWMGSLRPVKNRLIPQLSKIFRDQRTGRTAERILATSVLADYAADRSQVLADLLMDAVDEKQFTVIYKTLKERGEDAGPLWQGELEKKPMPDDAEDQKEALANRQVNAAVALLKMNHADKVWPLLKHSPDPRARSYLIHSLAPFGIDVMALVRRLDEEPDVSSRRALILCLGEFDTTQFPATKQETLIAKLLDLYRNDPDPGLHAAAEWLLRQKGWDQGTELAKIDGQLRIDEKQLQARKASDKRQWYVNTEWQTFVILNADKPFRMGSLEGEPHRLDDEVPHEHPIGRTFAIASKIVTKARFRHFQKDNLDVAEFDIEKVSRTDDAPQVLVDWYDGARYCNWLSQREGIPKEQWCYEPNAQGKYAEGMKPATDYLKRSGYRLPMDYEWEYACRSGSETSRYYGLRVKLLPKYAWFQGNSDDRAQPVGMKKPNDYGLFDMHGNVWQWCDNVYQVCAVSEDSETKTDVRDRDCRELRGGSFLYPALAVRSARRHSLSPTNRAPIAGFRPARTLP